MNKLIDNIDKLKKLKSFVIEAWLCEKNVVAVLSKYDISPKQFVKDYAISIFDYYISVLEKRSKIGDCPAIGKLLIYLKGKNVGTDELFVICAGFKNGLILFMYNQNINTLEIQQEILNIYERNFEGVLKQYSQTIYEIDHQLQVSKNLIDENIIISSTDLNGVITAVSKAFCEISGYSKDELIGNSHSMVRHPDMKKELFQNMWSRIKGEKVWHGEIKNRRKDGSFYWVEAVIGPEYDIEGNHIGYSAVRHDITYKMESEVQQEIILEQSKVTAMSQMISMIAHQWRQPLQSIALLVQKLPIEKLIDGELSDEHLNQVVNDVDIQLKYMSKTIEDFRSYFSSCKQKEEKSTQEIIQKVKDIVGLSFLIDDIKINYHINTYNLKVYTNDIVQVIINILTNAKEVLNKKNSDNKVINLSCYKLKDNIIFEIEDNGGGIPNIIMNKIFEPYFSTKKNKNGTGLGLYMSKTIVEKQSDGILSVENKNDGASFKIILPIN